MSERGEFFTYLWLREDKTPYYVGKAKQLRRAYGSGIHSVNCPSKDRVVVLVWSSEKEALDAEVLLIAYYGRRDLGTGILHNHTAGGEGTSGHKQSSETIEKRVSKIKGKTRPKAVRNKLSMGKLGDKNPSYRARGTSHWNRGLVRSEETKQKIRQKRALQDMSLRVKEFCKRGHARTPDNVSKNGTCLICKKLLKVQGGTT